MANNTVNINKAGINLYDANGAVYTQTLNLKLYEISASQFALPYTQWETGPIMASGVGSYTYTAGKANWSVSLTTLNSSGAYFLTAQTLDFSQKGMWTDVKDWSKVGNGNINLALIPTNMNDLYAGVASQNLALHTSAVPEPPYYHFFVTAIFLGAAFFLATKRQRERRRL